MFSAKDFAARLSAREDRWSLLKDFIAEWHSPLEPGDGYPASELDAAEQRLRLKLPLALREWYGLAGKRDDLSSIDPYGFFGPQELNLDEDDCEVLWLFSETQADISWGIKQQDLSQDDPPVYSENSYASAELLLANKTLSEFALQVVVHQTACFTEIGGNAAGDARTAEIVNANFLPLGLPIWSYPVYPSQLFGGDDALIELNQDGKGYCYISVAALTEAALSHTVRLLNLGWDRLHNGVSINEIN